MILYTTIQMTLALRALHVLVLACIHWLIVRSAESFAHRLSFRGLCVRCLSVSFNNIRLDMSGGKLLKWHLSSIFVIYWKLSDLYWKCIFPTINAAITHKSSMRFVVSHCLIIVYVALASWVYCLFLISSLNTRLRATSTIAFSLLRLVI